MDVIKYILCQLDWFLLAKSLNYDHQRFNFLINVLGLKKPVKVSS